MSTKSNSNFLYKTKSFSLNDILSKDMKEFETTIQEPILLQSLNNNSKEVRSYLQIHLPRLLKITFRDNNDQATICALKLLTAKNARHIPTLVKSTYFPEFAIKILSKDNVPKKFIGRLCDISLNIFSSANKDFLKNGSFILLFLRFIDDYNVCHMFSRLFANKEKFIPVQDWLFEIGFANEICALLEEMLALDFDDAKNRAQESKLISLLQILDEALQNQHTRQQVLSGAIPSVFNRKFSLPMHAYNYLWTTLNLMYDEAHKDKFEFYAKNAREIILNGHINTIHQYHSEALKFLTNYLDNDPELIDSALLKSVFDMMKLFENCGYFLIDAKAFILKVCHSKKNASKIEKYIPILLRSASEETSSPSKIISLSILEDLLYEESTLHLLNKVKGSHDFITNILEPYIKVKNADYGIAVEKLNNLKHKSSKRSFWETLYPKS